MTQRASESLVAVLIRIGLLLALVIMLMAENAQAQRFPFPRRVTSRTGNPTSLQPRNAAAGALAPIGRRSRQSPPVVGARRLHEVRKTTLVPYLRSFTLRHFYHTLVRPAGGRQWRGDSCRNSSGYSCGFSCFRRSSWLNQPLRSQKMLCVPDTSASSSSYAVPTSVTICNSTRMARSMGRPQSAPLRFPPSRSGR